MGSSSTQFQDIKADDLHDEFSYLIVRPERGGIWDLMKYSLMGNIESGAMFLESSDHGLVGGEAADHRWVILVSIIARKIIHLISKPMEFTGFVVDFFLNLIYQNGSLFGLLHNLLHGDVVIPKRGTKTFISTIGQLDERIELYQGNKVLEVLHNSASGEGIKRVEMDDRATMDLCMMASKLSYENPEVVRDVVMHFVDFYNCWDDYQKEKSTQVFLLCDKPKDANLILIAFRGTEPFDADDWSTDFDYSWYEIPGVGKMHMGFLEALGLGNREDTVTFHYHLQMNIYSEAAKMKSSNADFHPAGSTDSRNTDIPPDMVEMTAYYMVREKLRSLLNEHKNAKYIVTGHSLGGALAIMFPTVLVLHEEMKLMEKLFGVYTFGQPRIGDRQIGRFMETHLDRPVPKYFRVVYCNDLVPRLPYDDKTFLYKHFGVCLYYNSFYMEKRMEEEPNKNYFGITHLIPEHLNAVWELIRSLIMGYIYGPEYREGWFAMVARVLGLALPGIAAHCPTDYVNSVRLGKQSSI
ncbi:Lipase, class 3 [Corchorus olitorius]|uniref:Lipase, class 3 n=1 Tax=Corchorus olitorius TaxID=93759 RepID=A0A1R3H6H7_9ROSI|nr:Lipase, class 3 [Corchorus olitorius]